MDVFIVMGATIFVILLFVVPIMWMKERADALGWYEKDEKDE